MIITYVHFDVYTHVHTYVSLNSIPGRGRIKFKNWVYVVVISRIITSYCSVDIE